MTAPSFPQFQRLQISANSVVKADGTCTIAFQAPQSGYIWTGSIAVVNNSGVVSWLISIGPVVWGQTVGLSCSGTIQAMAGEIVTLFAGMLVPGTSYTAIFTGISSDESLTELIYPTSVVSVVTGPQATAVGLQVSNTIATLVARIGPVIVYNAWLASVASGVGRAFITDNLGNQVLTLATGTGNQSLALGCNGVTFQGPMLIGTNTASVTVDGGIYYS